MIIFDPVSNDDFCHSGRFEAVRQDSEQSLFAQPSAPN